MSGIKLNYSFKNENLPTSLSLTEEIAKLPSLVIWAQADPEFVEMDGNEVIKFTDRGKSSAYFEAASTGAKAELSSAELNEYSAAKFAGDTTNDGTPDVYELLGGNLDTENPYTFVLVFKPEDNMNGDTVLSRFTSPTERAIINLPAGGTSINFQHGSTPSLSHPITLGEWCFLIAASDGQNVKLFADGYDYQPKTILGTSGVGQLCLGGLYPTGGQAFDGCISDVLIFNEDLFQNQSALKLVKDYMKFVYGL